MGITAIIFLILLGILLIWLEFLVIPGTTIAGIGGILIIGVAIFFSFRTHGNTFGLISLFSTLVLLILSTVLFLKSKTWKKIGLKAKIEATVDSFDQDKVNLGDKGKTITRLAPSGKIRVNGIEMEAESVSGLIDVGVEVEIIEVLKYKVFVKLLN